jgi:hypothetical protein
MERKFSIRMDMMLVVPNLLTSSAAERSPPKVAMGTPLRGGLDPSRSSLARLPG